MTTAIILRYKQPLKDHPESLVITSNLSDYVSSLCSRRFGSKLPRAKIDVVSSRINKLLSTVPTGVKGWPHLFGNTAGTYISPKTVSLNPKWTGQSELGWFYRSMLVDTIALQKTFNGLDEFRVRMTEEEDQSIAPSRQRRRNKEITPAEMCTVAQECLMAYTRALFTLSRSTLTDYMAHREAEKADGYGCEIFSNHTCTVEIAEGLADAKSQWGPAIKGLTYSAQSQDANAQACYAQTMIRLTKWVNEHMNEYNPTCLTSTSVANIDTAPMESSRERWLNIKKQAAAAAEGHRVQLKSNCERLGISFDEVYSKSFKEIAADAFSHFTGYANLHHLRAIKTLEFIAEINEEKLRLETLKAQRDRHVAARSDDELTLVASNSPTEASSVAASTADTLLEYPLEPEPADIREFQVVKRSSARGRGKGRRASGDPWLGGEKPHPNRWQDIEARARRRSLAIGGRSKPSSKEIKKAELKMMTGMELDPSCFGVREWTEADLKELKEYMIVGVGADEAFYDEMVSRLSGRDEKGKTWFPTLGGVEEK